MTDGQHQPDGPRQPDGPHQPDAPYQPGAQRWPAASSYPPPPYQGGPYQGGPYAGGPAGGYYGSPPPPPPLPPRKPLTGLWIGLGVGALVLLLVCCGGVFVALRALNSAVDHAADDSYVVESPPDLVIPDPPRFDLPSEPPTLPSEPPKREPSGTIGQPVRLKDLEFTVLAAPACAARPLGQGTLRVKPKAGQHFCTVRIRATNRGAAAVQWSTIELGGYVSLDAIQPTDRVYGSGEPTFAANPNDFGVATIKPGRSWETTGVFELPVGQRLVAVDFRDLSSTDPVLVTL